MKPFDARKLIKLFIIIQLGIIMFVNIEIGMITPPVGLNLFVTSSLAGMPAMSVMRAALPFLSAPLVHASL